VSNACSSIAALVRVAVGGEWGGDIAHSRIMADTSHRMWDLSDFLINTSDVARPFSAALDGRHADHERILAALHAGDQANARVEMEKHIVGTVDVIRP
jgi:DNA-binding GntR family transcriptional regulator